MKKSLPKQKKLTVYGIATRDFFLCVCLLRTASTEIDNG